MGLAATATAGTPQPDPSYNGLTHRGMAAIKAGHIHEALADAQQAIALEPARMIGYVLEASALANMGEPADSQKAMDRAIELAPADQRDHLRAIAQSYQSLGEHRHSANGPIYDVREVDVVPRPTYQTTPNFPSKLRQDGVSGRVVVEFIVDSKGQVRNAFASSATHAGFVPEAVHCVSQWKFTPAQKDHHPVEVHLVVPIVFDVNGG